MTILSQVLLSRRSMIALVLANKRLQPTAFGAGMRSAFCQQLLWLLERVLPESAAAEPQR